MKGISTEAPGAGPHMADDGTERQSGFAARTVEIDCLCCDCDRFEFDGLIRCPSKTVARFECVQCGAASEIRLTGGER